MKILKWCFNVRYATNSNSCRERDYSKAKSRSFLDKDDKCARCDQPGGVSVDSVTTIIKCALCGLIIHKSCHPGWTDELCEGSWLCSSCHVNEKAWSAEDFDHDEDDPTDRVLSSARKAPAKAKRKAKPAKTPGKSIECIDLSSDTDIEDNKEYQDVLIMNEEERRHYFGGDHDSDTSEDPEEDPFAAINALHEELQNGDCRIYQKRIFD